MISIVEKDISKLATVQTPAHTKYYADIYALPDLIEVNRYAENKHLKLQVIGKGSNVLFTKEHYSDRLFIRLKKEFNSFNLMNNSVQIGAAFLLKKAGARLIEKGYKDFTYMCLIPGTLGGAVRQNAGTTQEGEIRDNLLSVRLFDTQSSEEVTLSNKEMLFSYRNSLVQQEHDRYIVLSAIFSCGDPVNDIEGLKKEVENKKKMKREKEPRGYSFGSTFKSRLHERAAWYYLDQVGLRNYTVGGAKFSQKHPNWIINYNNATAKDVMALISKAKDRVNKQFNIELIEEVELI